MILFIRRESNNI